MIDPESDSEDDNNKFVDDYDKTGRRVDLKEAQAAQQKAMTDFDKTKTYTSGFIGKSFQDNMNRSTAPDGFDEGFWLDRKLWFVIVNVSIESFMQI